MKKLDKKNKQFTIQKSPELGDFRYVQKKGIELRRQVNELHFKFGISKSEIARQKHVSRMFVIRWTEKPDMDVTEDKRGWPKKTSRKWGKETYRKVKKLHKKLSSDPKRYFFGATAIELAWKKKYPQDSCPPLRTLGRMLKDQNLITKRKGCRSKGAARYLCYPEYSIYHHICNGRLLEADFMGEKYIHGRSAPVNFLGYSFKIKPKLRHFKRIESQTSKEFIRYTKRFIKDFEKPPGVKVDNALAFRGSASGKRNISATMKYLLSEEIIPIFAVPRKPFSQASIEGNNSVFSRKFWNRTEFTSLEQVDEELEWFNDASLEYSQYWEDKKTGPKDKPSLRGFKPCIYFIRQVQDSAVSEDGQIDVLNESIQMPEEYINYFVLAHWDLSAEQLTVSIEKEQKLHNIKRVKFRINSDYKI